MGFRGLGWRIEQMWLTGKIIGSICVATAFYLIGCELERRVKLRWKLLAEAEEVLVWLEKEMTYHKSTAEDALSEASRHCSTVLKLVLSDTARKIQAHDGAIFREIWERAVDTYILPGLLRKDQQQVLRDLADAMCCTDTVMQRTMLKKYAQRLEQMSREEAEDCAQKGRLYRRLAAAAGAFVIIMLL